MPLQKQKKQNAFFLRGLIFVVAFLVLIFSFGAQKSLAAINEKINYQGKLTDGSNVIVADGAYDVVFKLYTSALDSASPIWTESWTSSALFSNAGTTFTNDGCATGVDRMAYTGDTNEGTLVAGQSLWNTTKKESATIESVNASGSGGYVCFYDPYSTWTSGDAITNRIYIRNGLFSTMLGSVTTFASQNVDFNQTLYLGVTIGADPEMKPRKVVGSTPSAFTAKTLNNNGSATLGTNAGATLSIGNTTGAVTMLSGGASSWNNTSGNLTVSTTTSGTLAITSAGALNLSAASASTVTLANVTNAMNFDGGTLSIDALNNRIGIGTTDPGASLQIVGADSLSTSFAANISGATSTGLVITNAGNVGIGTTNPQNKFQVVGNLSSYAGITSGVGLQGNSSGSGLITAVNLSAADPTSGISNGANFGFNGSSNNFYGMGLGSARNSKFDMWFQTGAINGGGYRWYVGTNEIMTINNSGNIGIGTTNPTTKLTIQQTDDVSGLRIYGYDNKSTNYIEMFNPDIGGSDGGFIYSNNNLWLNTSDNRFVRIGYTTNQTEGLMIYDTLKLVLGASTGDPYLSGNGTDLVTFDLIGDQSQKLGIINGNVGIGTTNPGSLLDVAGTARMTGFQLGTSTTANYVLTADANGVGTWQVATGGGLSGGTNNYIPIWTGATSQSISAMYQINGNVGIGTTNPGAKFDIVTVANSTAIRSSDGTVITGIFNGTAGGFSGGWIGTHTNHPLAFQINASAIPSMFISTDSNVGIGTTNPGSLLDVAGTAKMTGFQLGTSTTSGYVLTTDVNGVGTWQMATGGGLSGGTNNYIPLWTGATSQSISAMYQINGNVGIGTTAPTAFLDLVAATVDVASLRIEASASIDPSAPNIGDLWFNGTNLFFRKDGSTSQDLLAGILWADQGGYINAVNATNVSITDTGAFGVGTNNPGATIEIDSQSTGLDGLKISNLGSANYAINLSATGLAGVSDYHIYMNGDTYWRADGAMSTTGAMSASSYLDYDNSAYYLDPANATVSMAVAGKVGIGTVSPGNLLSINAAAGGNPALDFRIGETAIFSMGIDDNDSDKFKIESGSVIGGATPAFVIDGMGNIGIGSASPDNLLTLNIASGDPVLDFRIANTTKFSVGVDDSDNDMFKIETGASLGSAAPAFGINSSGNVGVGTSNPTTRLYLNGGHFTLGALNATTSAQMYFREGTDNGSEYVGLDAPNSVDSSFTLTLPSALGTNGQILQTDASGNLTWTANAATGMSNPTTTVGDLIYASVTGTPATVTRLGIGTAGQCLTVSAGVPVWGSCSGTAAGGATTQVIFNNAGTYTGSANFTWDNTNFTLSSLGTIAGAKVSLALRNTNAGATASNELRIGNDTLANALSLTINSSAFTGAVNYAYIYNKANAPMLFGTNNLERARIDANGNLGLGHTAPTAKLHILDNVVTAGNAVLVTSTSLSSGSLMSLQSTGTAAASGTQTVLNIATSGANGTTTQTTYGLIVNNTHTGTTLTNVGGYFLANTASASAINYSLLTGAMAGATSYGLSIGTLSGATTNVGVNIGNISAGATSDYGVLIGTIAGGGVGSALTTGAISTTGATTTQINLGAITGANATSHTGIALGAISGTTAAAYGITTSTITGGTASNIAIQTGAISGTATNNYGVVVGTVTGGSTANYGVTIGALTPNATTNYGLNITAFATAAGATKYNIYAGGITANNASTNVDLYLGAIGGSTGNSTNTGIQIANISGTAGTGSNSQISLGTISGTATNGYGINVGTVTGGTTGNYGINIQAVTGIVGATNAGLNIAGLAGPATSTVYGINVAANTATGTASYGMRITGPTGAATSNYGLNVVMPSAATHNSGLVIGTVATTSGTWALYSSAANNSYFAGNVGIGIAVPASKLHILSTSAASLQIDPFGASAGNTGELRFLELAASGTDYAGFKAPDAIATNAKVVLTLPSTFGTNGQILQTSATGVLSWANNAATGMSNVLTTTGDMVYSSSGTTAARLGIGSTGQCLTISAGVPVWGSCSGTAAGGANTQVIFNNAGAYAGSANFIWDNTNFTLSSLGSRTGAKISLALRNTDTGTATTNELQIGNDAFVNTLSLLVNSSTFTSNLNNAYILNKSTTNPGALILGTNNAERMRIDGTGTIGIGAAGVFTTALPPKSLLDISRNAIATAQNDAYGLSLNNNSAAANNAQQWSPPIRFRGYGWNTAASQSVDVRMFVRPIQAATNPWGALDIQSSINGAVYNDLFTILSTAAVNGVSVGIGTNTPTSKLHIVDAIATTTNTIYANATILTSGNLMYLYSNNTTALTNQTMGRFEATGTNATAAQTTYGIQALNTHGGTTATNVAGNFQAINGVTNYGLQVLAMTGLTNYGLNIGAMSGGTTNIGLNIGNISNGNTSDYGIYMGTISGGGTGAALVSGAVSTTGANAYQLNLGAVSGANATAHYGINLGAISGVTANAFGINVGTMTGGTAGIYGVYLGAITTNYSAISYGMHIQPMTGAGTTAAAINIGALTTTGVNNYGINIGGLTGVGAVNSYGLNIGAISGSTTIKYSIATGGITGNTNGTNASVVLGAIASSTVPTISNTQITTGAVSGGATNNYQLNLSTVTGGTTGNYGINIAAVTGIAGATNAGINLAGVAGPATSTVYGINVLANSATGTASYGMKLAGPTGAAGSNYGLNIVQPTGSTHDAALEIGAVATGAGDWAIYSSGTVASYFAGSIGIGINAPVSLMHLKASTAATLQIDPFGASAGNTGEFRMLELTAAGTNYVSLKAPDSITSNVSLTLPASLGTNGQVLQTNATGVLSWANNSASGMANPMTTTGDIIYGSTTATPANPARLGIGTAGQCLIVSGGLPAWGACSGSSAAAGSTTQVQFNNAGSFGASANFIWDNTNYTLSSLGSITGGKISLALRNTGTGTADTNELRIGNDAYANALSLSINSSAFTSNLNNAYILNKSTTNPGALILGTNNVERMRIDGAGNIGIGAAGSFTTAAPPLSLLDLTRNSIGSTQSDAYGLTLNNNTAASSGAQQYSPALRFRGYGYTGSASQSMDMRVYVRPVQTAPLTGGLDFQSSIAGATYVDLMTLLGGASGGVLGIGTNAPTSTRLHIVDNVITTGNGILATTNSMTTGNLVSFSSTSTSANSNTQTVLNIATSGTNTNSTQTTYGLQSANTHAGTLSTNVSGLFTATGGTTANIGVRVAAMTGNTSIGFDVQTMTGLVSNIGVNVTSFTGTGAAINTGVAIGAFSGSTGAATNTGVSIGAIGGTSANAYGINMGTLTGGTTGNYQINTGIITSVASASNYGINLGGTTGTAALSNNYGIKIGTMNSTGNANYGLNIVSPTGATHNAALEIGTAATTAGTWSLYSSSVSPAYLAGSVGIGTTAPIGQFQVAATAAPTTDMMTISNTGYAVITAGTSALQVNYVGGAAAVEASSIRADITAGGTTGGTWNAIRLVGSTAASGVNENAIKIDALTAGAGMESALNIGTGWDFGIYSQTVGVNYFAGNVGIGTTNPLAAFHVYSGASGANPAMLLAGNSGGDTDFWISRVNDGANDDDDTFQIGDGVIPGTNPFLTIDTLGNIGIGTTAPSAQLHTTGTVRFASIVSGNLTADANGNVTSSSDERLKDVNGMFTRGLESILALNPINYHWNRISGLDMQNQYSGFSAQNVKTSIPEAVGVDSRGYLTLSDRPILAAAVNAIKEQQVEIMQHENNDKKQETEIAKLLGGDISLEGKLNIISEALINIDAKTQALPFLQAQLDRQTKDLAELQKQMADIQLQNKAFNEFLLAFDVTNIDNFAKKNAQLNIFAGKLEADGMVAGAFSVRVVDETKKTLGSVIICEEGKISKEDTCIDPAEKEIPSDGKMIEIATTAVTAESKIFITPIGKTPVSWIISEIDPGIGFTIALEEKVSQAVKFNWWIVETAK